MPSNDFHNSKLSDMESKLRSLWARYVEHLDRFGAGNEKSVTLRQEYFELYRLYLREKKWTQVSSPNEESTR